MFSFCLINKYYIFVPNVREHNLIITMKLSQLQNNKNMANLFCVKDKVVIITGGAGILGRGIAGHLAEEGAKIVILDRAAEVGEQIVADIKAKGGEASFFLTDVLNKEILEQNKKDPGQIRSYRCIAECSRRKYGWCDHRAGQHDFRPEHRRFPQGGRFEPVRDSSSDNGICRCDG